jgi:tetratricopeptide (TPR) repeat protein
MSQPSQPPLEVAWQTLRASLEWAHEFALVFVFCNDSAIKQALFRRADDLMRAQVKPFERPPIQHAADFVETLLTIAVRPASVHVDGAMPLWLDLDGRPGDGEWDAARLEFLHRLNERRASLVREHLGAVVLALPQDWTKQAAEAAPDLWTIRQPSVYLGPSAATAASPRAKGPDGAFVSRPQLPPTAAVGQLPGSVDLMQQATEASPSALRSVWDRLREVDMALAYGRPDVALQTARETVAFAEVAIAAHRKNPERLRDLSVSMNKLGDVAQALGQLEEAKAAYAQGEALARALIDDYGKNPERLRDLSLSMERLGDVARALGQLEEAETAYAQGEALARELIDVYGESVLSLDVLASSTLHLGQVMAQRGEPAAGKPQYAKARLLYKRLALAMPHEARYRNALGQVDAAIAAQATDSSAG